MCVSSTACVPSVFTFAERIVHLSLSWLLLSSCYFHPHIGSHYSSNCPSVLMVDGASNGLTGGDILRPQVLHLLTALDRLGVVAMGIAVSGEEAD